MCQTIIVLESTIKQHHYNLTIKILFKLHLIKENICTLDYSGIILVQTWTRFFITFLALDPVFIGAAVGVRRGYRRTEAGSRAGSAIAVFSALRPPRPFTPQTHT